MNVATDLAPLSYSGSDSAFINTLGSHGIPSLEMSPAFRFYILLGIAREMRVDFLPITYQSVLGAVGRGATADVRQLPFNSQVNLAFKRVLSDYVLLNEMIILSIYSVRSHPHIIGIEGLSWEAAEDGYMRPVLVIEKTELGDLNRFMSTTAGTQTSFTERWSLCTQIASAVATLHSASVVHGDIKPHNILIFKSESAELTTKLADFGYSRWLAPQESDSLIYLPQSRPWTAPEYHHRGFNFIASTKQDVYCFGVFVLWLLFYNQPKSENDFITDTSDLERRSMIELARSHVDELDDAANENKAVLREIFELCLAAQPEHRLPMNDVLALFQSVLPKNSSILVQIFDSSSNSQDIRSQKLARFQIAPAVPQLFEIDFRVRHQIYQCLRQLVDETSQIDHLGLHEEVCLQLALCYKLGFGVARSDTEATKLLAESYSSDILDDQLIALKASVGQGYNPSTVYSFWAARGYISTTVTTQYHREQKLLASILAVHKREIADWAIVLEPSHWIVLQAARNFQTILENVGLLDEAEKLARDMFDEVSRTLPGNHVSVRHQKLSLARVLYVQGKLHIAKRLVKELLKSKSGCSNDFDATNLIETGLLVGIYTGEGRMKKAISLIETLIQKSASTFGSNHENTLILRWNLCEILRQQRRIKKAIPLAEDLLQVVTAALGENHELYVITKISLIVLRWERRTWLGGYNGPRDDGTLRMDHIKTSQTLLGNDHPYTLRLLEATVRNLVAKARFSEAIALQEEIIRLSEKRPGPTHKHTEQRRQQLKNIRKMYFGYRFMEKIGTLYVGQYILTPSLRVRPGLERICWPVHKQKDETKIEIDFSIGLDEIQSDLVIQPASI